MRLHIIAFGKLKTPGLREAADHYLKGLRPWVNVEELELKALPVPGKIDKTDQAERKQIQQKEAEVLLGKLKDRARSGLYLLDETGKCAPTREWAGWVREWEQLGISEVAFCLGSSLGFSPALREKARGVLSLGPQTLSHELARVVLLEQIFRAYSVVRGHPYHNEG